MQEALIQFLAGGIGGLVRGLVGITKAQTFNPDTFKFQWKYFAVTVIVSMIVGQMAGLIANADWRMSLLAGYAGSDFLESMYKLSFARFVK
jgi:fluoride ion exporter CrcB/FEX